MDRPWIAFFSQTGSEIVDIIDRLGKQPDLIITNHRPSDKREINKNLPLLIQNSKIIRELFFEFIQSNDFKKEYDNVTNLVLYLSIAF